MSFNSALWKKAADAVEKLAQETNPLAGVHDSLVPRELLTPEGVGKPGGGAGISKSVAPLPGTNPAAARPGTDTQYYRYESKLLGPLYTKSPRDWTPRGYQDLIPKKDPEGRDITTGYGYPVLELVEQHDNVVSPHEVAKLKTNPWPQIHALASRDPLAWQPAARQLLDTMPTRTTRDAVDRVLADDRGSPGFMQRNRLHHQVAAPYYDTSRFPTPFWDTRSRDHPREQVRRLPIEERDRLYLPLQNAGYWPPSSFLPHVRSGAALSEYSDQTGIPVPKLRSESVSGTTHHHNLNMLEYRRWLEQALRAGVHPDALHHFLQAGRE
jgi:hypothetical protein